MSALSTHLIDAHTRPTDPSALPSFASASQTLRNPPAVITSGSMSYNPTMHGSFSAYPPFSQPPHPILGSGYNPTAPRPTIPHAHADPSLPTAQQIATLQAKLDKKLGPEFISQRPGPGGQGKLTYAEGWKIINLANEVFGFNGWSSSITSLAIDYIDLNEQTQRYSVGVTAIVKVVLRDGVYHEDVGYGMLDNCKQKGMALDKCKKEAVTDALKRTLRNFGNLLGNCLYDKEYTKEVVKIQIPPPRFDRSELHRRPEYADRSISRTSIPGPSNAGHSNMGPPPTVPKRTPPTQSAPAPQPHNQARKSLQQIESRPQQEPPGKSAIPLPQPQPQHAPITKPAAATTSTTARSDILAALAGSSPVSAISPLPPNNAPLQPQPTGHVPPAQPARQQFPSFQPHPPEHVASEPLLKAEPSQEEFADFAEGDDSFYNDMNLESFHASTTLVDKRGLDPSPPPAISADADSKGKGRMSAILSGLMEDSPAQDRSFGIGPPPAYASPLPLLKPTSFTTASGSAVKNAVKDAVKGPQGGGGFIIPAGVSRPNRTAPPPPPGRTAGVKRSAGDAFTSGKKATPGIPGVDGRVTMHRPVLGELEVGSDGTVLKRVRR